MAYVSPTPTSKNGTHDVHSRTILALPRAAAPIAFRSRLSPPLMGRCSRPRAAGALAAAVPWSRLDMEAGQITDMGGPTAGSSSASGGSSKESSDLPGEPGAVVDESAMPPGLCRRSGAMLSSLGTCPASAGGTSGRKDGATRPGCITGAVVVAGEGGPCGFLGPPLSRIDISTAAFNRLSFSGLCPSSSSTLL
jgi:hypothetical protein